MYLHINAKDMKCNALDKQGNQGIIFLQTNKLKQNKWRHMLACPVRITCIFQLAISPHTDWDRNAIICGQVEGKKAVANVTNLIYILIN